MIPPYSGWTQAGEAAATLYEAPFLLIAMMILAAAWIPKTVGLGCDLRSLGLMGAGALALLPELPSTRGPRTHPTPGHHGRWRPEHWSRLTTRLRNERDERADLGQGFVADIELAEQRFLGVAQSIGIRPLCRENHLCPTDPHPVPMKYHARRDPQMNDVGAHVITRRFPGVQVDGTARISTDCQRAL